MTRWKIPKPQNIKGERRDQNEREIIDFAEKVGIAMKQAGKNEGYDCLAICRGKIAIIEIKNHDRMPKSKNRESMLTPNEKNAKAWFEANGVPYHIILYPEEMLSVFDLDKK